LLRWVTTPATRPCSLEDLIVITSQVGDEYTDTGRDVEAHILPLMRAQGIRYVQVARHGHFEADGIAVLDDSRTPAGCSWKANTTPSAGRRSIRCSNGVGTG